MIRTLAINQRNELFQDLSVKVIVSGDFAWYWIDFNNPQEDECKLLQDPLGFHPLAIEDCIYTLQRPKLDYYDINDFFVTQSLNQKTFSKEEVDFFLGNTYIVTFHQKPSAEINDVWDRLLSSNSFDSWEPSHVLYSIFDKMVDNYFPPVYQIEDRLNEIDENSKQRSMEELLEDLFDTRQLLLSLRHTVTPMRDLLYRILNSQRLEALQDKKVYFSDIYDHLLKLTEMIEANRELAQDIRDSYISLNSHETNHVMKVLTVITTIFMPLTFIAGVYGMNFHYMPELNWKFGYFGSLLLMLVIGTLMSWWFMKKGWFK